MIVFGIALFIAGVISAIYGNAQNNDYSAQFQSILSGGSVNPGDTFLYMGIIIAIIGVILFIAGIARNNNNS